MDNRRNYYRILHVQPDAPTQVIRASYRTLMQRMKLHPDLGGDTATASLINEAWNVLSNERSRAQYDRTFDRFHRGAGNADAADDDRHASASEAQAQTNQEHAGASAHAGKQRKSSPDRCAFCGLPHGPTASLDILDDCGRCASPLLPAQAAAASEDPQRAIERLSRRHQLTFFANGDTQTATAGQTRDISPNGLQFVTDRPPATGQVIKLVTPVCVAVARTVNVRRCPGPEPSRWQVGVTFLTLRFESPSGSFVSATV